MKNLLYIGNKLNNRKANISTIDVLGGVLEQSGYRVYYASNKTNKGIRLMDMIKEVIKRRHQVDYVIIDTYSTLNFYYAYVVSQLCRYFKIKYIPVLHGGNLLQRLKQSPKMSAAIFKNAKVNVAPSLFLESQFKEEGYDNIVNIPNGIKLSDYPFSFNSIEDIHLLWVRAFADIYNPLLAIDVLKLLKDDGLQATLTMVGPDKDGSLRKAENYAKTLGVEVQFTGKLDRNDWINYAKHCNVFINTTSYDNMPVSVIEAMALGLPVVSTNVGGIPFLINNKKQGILIPPNSAEAFVAAIKMLKTNSEFTKNIALNARKKVEMYDWDLVKTFWNKILV
ncbi:glycosyltransferase family 4 protein [Aestuariibaculum sediminum]|uniref:Glycosyltransferase family 4 protein n=1 Tax=Aestuariibaculum sediminum TaxID=2770637 RepID=A0A8J6Q0E2_9FLAO|nr:glycosyltransferase family 4 protein [Aestuariibaculum sediminum]MBD0833108.1 glycosyltransferase family 4 protein [Aestuariibaculum sediminum]